MRARAKLTATRIREAWRWLLLLHTWLPIFCELIAVEDSDSEDSSSTWGTHTTDWERRNSHVEEAEEPDQ